MQSQTPVIEAVSDFCAWAESDPSQPKAEAQVALALLSRLYALVLKIEVPAGVNFDLDGTRISDEEWSARFRRFGALPFNYYGDVDEPQEMPASDPTIGDLADDLADIYRDLKEGLSLAEAEHIPEAMYSWRESFRTHWGRHAASAIRALHIWCEDQAAW